MKAEDIKFIVDTLESAIEWGEYADTYFQDRHGLVEDQESVKKCIAILNGLKTKCCSSCHSENLKHEFLKEGTWMGSDKKPADLFRSSEFTFGWDYYPKFDLNTITCKECGFVEYEKKTN